GVGRAGRIDLTGQAAADGGAGGQSTADRRRQGRVVATREQRHDRQRAGDRPSGDHLGSSKIGPLKLRTVTWAPPVPVERRSSWPTPAARRCGAAAVSVFVMVPPIVSRSKSATVVAGTRTSSLPLRVSSSTTPP